MSTVRWLCTNTYFKSRITVKIGRTDQAKLHVMRQDWLGATANGVQWRYISIRVHYKEQRRYHGGRRLYWRQSRAKTIARRANYLVWNCCMGCEDLRTDCSNADCSWSENKQFRYFARLNGEVHSIVTLNFRRWRALCFTRFRYWPSRHSFPKRPWD